LVHLVLVRVFVVLAVLLALQSVVALGSGFSFLRFLRRSLLKPLSDYTPPVTVLIPVKGIESDGTSNLAGYLSQNYPRYQLVLSVATEEDPAFGLLSAQLRRHDERGSGCAASLVVAGVSECRGEKVNNLLRGVREIAADSRILVFADLDARPSKDWLRHLVEPLQKTRVMVSTGFRWYLPGQTFASRLRAAWDTSIATTLGDHHGNFAWGGSMAIRRADFERLEIAEVHWLKTVSDDYALTRAVNSACGKIYFEPRCLMAAREESSLADFLRWSTRQIIITRVYAPKLWAMGLASHGLYCLTFLLGLAVMLLPETSSWFRAGTAEWLAAILILGIAKGILRGNVARRLFPPDTATGSPARDCYWQLTPLVPWIMFWNFLVAAFQRRIEWRGTHYWLRSAEEVVVLKRESERAKPLKA
jgi:ceramide glucosyltransferase